MEKNEKHNSPTMSTVKKEFVQGYKPFTYKPNDQHCVYIGPVSATEAVLYMTDSQGTAVPIADKIEIFSFDTREYFTIGKKVVYFPMSLSTSYTIRFEGEIFMSGARDYPLSDRFTTKEQEFASLMQYFTILINGEIECDSPIIQISSTVGLKPGRMISGQGIPDDSIIVEVDHEKSCVTINQCCFESTRNVSIQVQNNSVLSYDEVEEELVYSPLPSVNTDF